MERQSSSVEGAIAALTRKRPFWFVSMGFGAVGVVFFVLGLLG